MDAVFKEVGAAFTEENGPRLAQTLSPEALTRDPDSLQRFFKGANAHDAKGVIKRKLQGNAPAMMAHSEAQGWAEIYYHLWKTVGEILAVSDGAGGKTKVGEPMLHGFDIMFHMAVIILDLQ